MSYEPGTAWASTKQLPSQSASCPSTKLPVCTPQKGNEPSALVTMSGLATPSSYIISRIPSHVMIMWCHSSTDENGAAAIMQLSLLLPLNRSKLSQYLSAASTFGFTQVSIVNSLGSVKGLTTRYDDARPVKSHSYDLSATGVFWGLEVGEGDEGNTDGAWDGTFPQIGSPHIDTMSHSASPDPLSAPRNTKRSTSLTTVLERPTEAAKESSRNNWPQRSSKNESVSGVTLMSMLKTPNSGQSAVADDEGPTMRFESPPKTKRQAPSVDPQFHEYASIFERTMAWSSRFSSRFSEPVIRWRPFSMPTVRINSPDPDARSIPSE